jgi:hypothetical protein
VGLFGWDVGENRIGGWIVFSFLFGNILRK